MAALELLATPTKTWFVATNSGVSFIDDLPCQTFEALEGVAIELLPPRTEDTQASRIFRWTILGAVADAEVEKLAGTALGTIG